MIAKIVALALFALMTVTLGVIGMRRSRTFNDFFLGGGKVGSLMTAFTYGAAYFSAVLFIGFAGKIGWAFGYSGLWIAVGNGLIGVLAVWWLMGWRIKKMATETQATTMAEFFEKRYQSKFLKYFSSLIIFIFLIPYSAAVFIGLSYLFKANFNIAYWQALVFMGLFTAIYLVLGGYKSITLVDVMFGIIMVVGSIVLLWSVLAKGGGLAGMTARLAAIQPQLTQWVGPPGVWPLVALVFLTSVAPFGMPQLIQKFYAIRDKKAVRVGMIASTLFALLISGAAYFTGAVARLFIAPDNAPQAFSNGKPIFDAVIPVLFATIIPGALSVLLLLLILAASMSTLAALVLISSSTVTKDLYAGFINPHASDRRLITLMRIFSAFFILLSVIMAYFRPATIVAILGMSWGAIGSAFLGPFVWGLLSKRAGKWGAMTSSVAGLATCITLSLTGWPSPEAGTIGMLVSLAVNPLVSIFLPQSGR